MDRAAAGYQGVAPHDLPRDDIGDVSRGQVLESSRDRRHLSTHAEPPPTAAAAALLGCPGT